MARNVALYVALRLAAWLLPRTPLRLAYMLAELAGNCAYYLFAGPRQGISANLAVVLHAPERSSRVRRAARAAFRYDAKNWVDTLRIGRLTDEEILGAVDFAGWEYLEEALHEGKGLVFVVIHLGNMDLVGQALAAKGERITIPVEHMQPERLFEFLLRQRRSKGINAVPIDRSSRAMLSALRAGEIVAIAGDRNVAGRGIQVEFFGKVATLPRGPAALARHTGAPVVVGLGVRLPSNRFQGIITPPVPLARSDNAESDERENARRIAAVMEGIIARYPDQWLVFAPLWARSRHDDMAATIGHPTKAAV